MLGEFAKMRQFIAGLQEEIKVSVEANRKLEKFLWEEVPMGCFYPSSPSDPEAENSIGGHPALAAIDVISALLKEVDGIRGDLMTMLDLEEARLYTPLISGMHDILIRIQTGEYYKREKDNDADPS